VLAQALEDIEFLGLVEFKADANWSATNDDGGRAI
jgi:hypothetical protein